MRRNLGDYRGSSAQRTEVVVWFLVNKSLTVWHSLAWAEEIIEWFPLPAPKKNLHNVISNLKLETKVSQKKALNYDL